MLYSRDQLPSRARCARCNEAYIEACPHCKKTIENSFISRAYPYTALPQRPDNCPGCRKTLPWADNRVTQRIEVGRVVLWQLLHPKVVELAKPCFENGLYTDAVETVFKELNTQKVQWFYLKAKEKEQDRTPLKRGTSSLVGPIMVLDNLSTEMGQSIQQMYMDIFARVIADILDPDLHENVNISAERAAHYLTLASLLIIWLEEEDEV